ncbi:MULTISPECIES: hypothetical protein [unclassified Methylobacterium]|jgi:hypothetical protein|uniref:hypothetical protein n=1 Tax=unclassified Methylobacterium TaxID=2615210 RepID=UPI001354D9EE|nr:hypothetical protein [Methylobacterium sp. 2A]MWV25025.1 hypothetical protein [Methylobacterium sp. 2A]
MDKINAATAHSSAHQSSHVEKAHKSDPNKDAEAQASKRSEEAERAKKVIDSRPSQARLKFQHSLNAAHGASDVENS